MAELIHLTPKQKAILQVLSGDFGHWVDSHEIATLAGTSRLSVKVLIWHMRRKLRGTGLSIEGQRFPRPKDPIIPGATGFQGQFRVVTTSK